jgi:hypothetical protein
LEFLKLGAIHSRPSGYSYRNSISYEFISEVIPFYEI